MGVRTSKMRAGGLIAGLISVFGCVKAIAPLGIGSSLEMKMNPAFLSVNLLISQTEEHRST
jgi:hypothetical protein